MAETQNGNAYYEAGTINEQLEDYEVYEENGRLYLNKEAADPESAVSFDVAATILQGSIASPPTNEEVGDFDEHMLFVADSGNIEIARRSDEDTDGNRFPENDAEVAPVVASGDFA